MKQILLGTALASFAFTTAASADIYKFDPGHTEIHFYYNHAGLSDQHGQWKVIDGEVDFDPANVEATKVTVTIDPASIDTGVTALDEHLKSADFFDVETYPTITFTSTGVEQTGDNTINLTGDLTIKDNTKPITMAFTLNHNGAHPLGEFVEFYQGEWIGVQGTGEMLRSDYGVGMFAPLTSDEVRLGISAELRKGGWPE
ncbi:YceI family protein [Aliiroseovarius crassostreae]|uniref:YceI family protein n=1 Tax=Aliiroseovarius crassostreae TaxID=154981 RepID=UPI0021FB87BE|nr:YceI family protein [Aliiroseovarius crassostreae]UWP91564.1 YceI family protein [Aliiroseovarius crassostreae]UWP97873.1 YceI family protein [Aliiroseovarius crassostreae]UWQ07297.1 YceI family protein [Aliiroseovarius crassostreae]UWQ10407.1 YceI family protein [Aliiroseovarius crassostreae]